MKVRLGDVCVKDSSGIAQKDLNGHSGEYPIYGASGYITSVDFYQQEQPYIAVVKDGAGVGRIMSLPAKSSVIGTMQYILPKNDIDIAYLAYAMEYMNLAKYYTGATIPHIYFKDYQNEMLPLPSLEEQRHIAAVLDKVSELISKRKAQLDKLDELVKSRFVEMFGDPIENSMGWPVYKLSELSTLITNGNTPKGGSENYISEGIIFLRSQNIWRNYLDLSEVAYIDRATHEMMKKSSVHCNDILITKTGRINTENSSLGRAAIFTGADNSANINGHVYLVRLGDKVLPLYILSILTSEAYRKYIRKVCVGGIDKRQINLDQVESFPIIKPPIETQTQFVQLYQQTEKAKMSVQKSLDQLETLKKALMQKYFG